MENRRKSPTYCKECLWFDPLYKKTKEDYVRLNVGYCTNPKGSCHEIINESEKCCVYGRAEKSIREAVTNDVMYELSRLFLYTEADIPDNVIEMIVNDVFNTSELSKGSNIYDLKDIMCSCERVLLHFIGHPEYKTL